MKRLNPYTYTSGNPIGLTDASGMVSTSLFGAERANNQLRDQNRQLVSVIGKLNSHISSLQGIIRRQQNYITDLVAQVRAMDAVIRQQATVIRQLQARVVYLTQQVNYWHARAVYWQRQANYWRGQAMYWRGQAIYWHGRALYYRGVIGQLVGRHFLPSHQQRVLNDIDAGLGIRSWHGESLGRAAAAPGAPARLGHHPTIRQVDGPGMYTRYLRGEIDDLEAEIGNLEDQLEGAGWCNTLTVAGSAVSAVDVGSTTLNAVPFVGPALSWASDNITDIPEGVLLAENVRSGCLGSAVSNMGLP